MNFIEDKYKPRIYLFFSLLFIAIVFVFTSIFIFKKFNNNIVTNELASQIRLAQIVDQLLTRYFYTIKFITQNTVLQPEFATINTEKEDGLLYKKISGKYAEGQLAKQNIKTILINQRQAIPIDSSSANLILKGNLYNWQIFKALPLYDTNGNLVAKNRRYRAKTILETYPDIYYVFQMKLNGDLIFLEPYNDQKNIKAFNYGFRDYLQLAKSYRDTSISEGYISSDQEETQIITVASPIFDNNHKIKTIFAASISANTLRDVVFKELKRNISANDQTIFYLIDRHGHVVASSNGKNIYFPIKDKKTDNLDQGNIRNIAILNNLGWHQDYFEQGNMWQRKVMSWDESKLINFKQATYLNANGIPVIGTFLPTSLGGNRKNWGVLIETPESQVLAEKNSVRKVFIISGALLALILLTLFYFTIRNFSKLEKKIIQKEEELIKTTTQVAHDIRSPLVSLDALIPQLKNVEEKTRVNVQQAISRINDIANTLVIKFKDNKDRKHTNLESALIAILVDNMISEKKIEFQHTNTSFVKDFSDQVYGTFVKINPTDLKRIVSNIINNSMEAILENGIIIIKLEQKIDSIVLSIIDNGCGISEAKIKHILSGTYISDKKTGAGLGLSFAREKIDSWEGKLEITSKHQQGTTVNIILPKARPAKWFKENIQITEDDEIVIIDDDESIHGVWQQRFTLPSGNNIKIHHFYNPIEISEWAKGRLLNNITFLVDYELLGYQENGIDIIEKLNIADKSVLVTSHFEDNIIREKCRKIKLKVIPKNYSLYIPINIVTKYPDLILIEDNDNVSYLWTEKASSCNMKIATFSSIDNFSKVMDLFDRNVKIYIDSNLEGEIKGEVFAKTLFDDWGYKNIYLSTGFSAGTFKEMYWIKEIVGKEPPF